MVTAVQTAVALGAKVLGRCALLTVTFFIKSRHHSLLHVHVLLDSHLAASHTMEDPAQHIHHGFDTRCLQCVPFETGLRSAAVERLRLILFGNIDITSM